MKPTPEELKRLLAGRTLPEPSEEARAKALQAALAEQRRLLEQEVRIKGTEHPARLTGKPDKGGPVMRKLAYAASVLVLVGVVAAIAIPNFLQFRMKAPSQEVRSNMGAGRSTEIDSPRAPFEDRAAAPPMADIATEIFYKCISSNWLWKDWLRSFTCVFRRTAWWVRFCTGRSS